MSKTPTPSAFGMSEKRTGDSHSAGSSTLRFYLRALTLPSLALYALLLAASGAIGYAAYGALATQRVAAAGAPASDALSVAITVLASTLNDYIAVTRELRALLFAGAVNASVTRPVKDALFAALCNQTVELYPAVISMQSRPGGVITQIYPPGSAPIGANLTTKFPGEYSASMLRPTGYVAGPRMLLQGFPGLVTYWQLWAEATGEWWGNLGIVVNLAAFEKHLDLRQYGYEYLLTMTNEFTGDAASFGAVNGTSSLLLTPRTQVASVVGIRITATFYEPPVDVSMDALAGGLVGGALGMAVTLTCFLAWRLRATAFRTKDISRAPVTGAITLVFTDIVGSTAKWAEEPAMPAALRVHHRVVREAVAAHDAFEVKVIGDSFMVAVHSPVAALSLANEIHDKLHKATWPADRSGNPLDLIVRVGVHTGTPAVVFDDVSKAPDYYGQPVNVAARLEHSAPHDFTLVSGDTLGLIDDEALRPFRLLPQTPLALKGVPRPIEVCVLAPPFRMYSMPSTE
jgi:class 3 adenylate cyclase